MIEVAECSFGGVGWWVGMWTRLDGECCQRSEEPEAELDEQDAETRSSCGEAIAAGRAHPLDQSFGAELPEVIAELGQPVGLRGELVTLQHAGVQVRSGPVGDETTGLEEYLQQPEHPIIMQADAGDTSLYQIPILANVIYTVPLDGKVKPYIGAGAGGVYALIDGKDTSESDFVFAWQVMAGADYQINDKWSAGLAYKLLGTGGGDWGGVKTDSFLTHSIVASVSYKF